jgi:short-subunit dehydrogenase
LELSAEQHQRVIDTNCRAAALLVHSLGEKMAERGRGGIVLVSSMAGFQGTATVAHYAATKAYLRVLAEGLWKELGAKGVDVLACCAGITDTATYRKTNPRSPGRLVGAPMDPAVVVAEALAALGKKPVMVPGRRNRLAQAIMQRVMPKKLAISIISAGTRAIYPKRP